MMGIETLPICQTALIVSNTMFAFYIFYSNFAHYIISKAVASNNEIS